MVEHEIKRNWHQLILCIALITGLYILLQFLLNSYREYAEPKIYPTHASPELLVDPVSGEEVIQVYEDEYVIYASAAWCPLDRYSQKPKTECPPEGYPAGVYVVNYDGEIVEEQENLVTYAFASDVEKDCVEQFGLPSGSACQRNMPVYAQNFNDDMLVGQWSYGVYKKLFPVLTPKNVRVAVFDTGVSPHPDLNVVTGKSFVTRQTSTTDQNGHGTHVAGSCCAINNNGTGVASPSNGTKVIPIKVLGKDGGGSLSGILKGIDWLIEYSKRNPTEKIVANFSLGAYGASSLCVGMRKLRDAGIIAVVAAGNDGKSLNTYKSYPAACADDEAIVVGSETLSGERSYFSNYGDLVDVYAPGSDILSTSKSGGYESMSGTSMATPFVAGVVANVLSCDMDGTKLEEILAENIKR